MSPTAPPGRSSRSALAHSIISAAWSSIFVRISIVATATARPVMYVERLPAVFQL